MKLVIKLPDVTKIDSGEDYMHIQSRDHDFFLQFLCDWKHVDADSKLQQSENLTEIERHCGKLNEKVERSHENWVYRPGKQYLHHLNLPREDEPKEKEA
jgi:hypothetical protein